MQQSQDNGVAVKLVDRPEIVKLWITVRVFSLASAWIEHAVQECYCKKTNLKIDRF